MNIYELLLAKAINGESGSGSNAGYEYEIGTYTPSVDESHPTITFAKEHNDAPVIYAVMGDVSETGYGDNDVVSVVFFDNYHALNEYYPDTAGNSTVYALNYPVYGNDTNYSSYSFTLITKLDGSSYSNTLGYYVSNTAIKPYAGGSGRKFRSTISYKWIAIWNHSAVEPTVHTYKFTGTIAQPFEDSELARQIHYIAYYYGLKLQLDYDASAIGFSNYTQPLSVYSNAFESTACDTVGLANYMKWEFYESGEGYTLNLEQASAFQGGFEQDLSPYASLVPSEITLYTTFPIPELSAYEVMT